MVVVLPLAPSYASSRSVISRSESMDIENRLFMENLSVSLSYL